MSVTGKKANVTGLFAVLAISVLLVCLADSALADSFRTVTPVDSIKRFDDVRWKDLNGLDLTQQADLIPTLTFNQATVWPERSKGLAKLLLEDAKNPGLGVRNLHEQGITGKGVNVGIIDQPLLLDHPEFAGKIVAYHDTGCDGEQSSMHGPAVASLLVGGECGTAPDAKVYYAAAPSWKRDAAYFAEALDWIIEQNNTLPAGEKIRVVSVSAAPSGPGSPFEKNNQQWDLACQRAEAAGILVLDCTVDHGFIGPCYYDFRAPENLHKCRAGFAASDANWSPTPGSILVPCAPRITAEQYEPNQFSYQYCGNGGLSWSIPYCAGILALGWQVKPQLDVTQMRELLFASAFVTEDGCKIIHPRNFIRFVKNPKLAKRAERKRKAATARALGEVSQSPVGKWVSVDYVSDINDFVPGQKRWQGDLFLKDFTFYSRGRTSIGWTWEEDYVQEPDSKIKARFEIRRFDGVSYLFLPWLSGDVTIRGAKPDYYVLKKATAGQKPTSPAGHDTTQTQAVADATQAALKWLDLIDSAQYGRSWDQAAEHFKAALTKQQWQSSVAQIRSALGKLLGREVKEKRYTGQLPGAPDGQYVLILFDASFEKREVAVENVTCVLDKDGKWRVLGYYIK